MIRVIEQPRRPIGPNPELRGAVVKSVEVRRREPPPPLPPPPPSPQTAPAPPVLEPQPAAPADSADDGSWWPQVVEFSRESFLQDRELHERAGFTLEIGEQVWPLMYTSVRLDALELFRAAKTIPDGGTYCEIGSAKGGSLLLVHLALESVGRTARLIAVDPHVQATLMGVVRRTGASFHLGRSQEVADVIPGGLDMLLIDGGHEYCQVAQDLDLYLPKVRDGGLVMVHDFDWKDSGETHTGVVRAVLERTGQYELVRPRNCGYVKFVKE